MTPGDRGLFQQRPWRSPPPRPARAVRLTVEQVEQDGALRELMEWQRAFLCKILDGAGVIQRPHIMPTGEPTRAPVSPPWAVVPCGRPRVGMAVAVPNADRVTIRHTPGLVLERP